MPFDLAPPVFSSQIVEGVHLTFLHQRPISVYLGGPVTRLSAVFIDVVALWQRYYVAACWRCHARASTLLDRNLRSTGTGLTPYGRSSVARDEINFLAIAPFYISMRPAPVLYWRSALHRSGH